MMSTTDSGQRRTPGLAGGWWPAVVCCLAVLVVLEAAHGLGVQWLQWRVTASWNPAFLEGLSWWHGSLSLPQRLWDTAYVPETGEVYNVFPPLQSLIGFLATAPQRSVADLGQVPEMHILPLVLFGLPLPLVGYLVFHRRTGSCFWGAVLTLGWLGGTAILPCIHLARDDGVHHINHLLSQVGLLLLAGELLGRRRIWVAVVGLLIAAWSRQLTGVFALALLAVAWQGASSESVRSLWSAPRIRRLAITAAAVAATAAVPLGLNWAKFGSPLRNGYELIYEGRDHELAGSARAHGLFSPRFVGRNAYYMNLAGPWGRPERGGLGWQPSEHGTSIWLTTPLLALVLLGIRTWWGYLPARALMLCSALVIAALLLYHGTGQRQFGYYRFALDFIPVWLVVGGPWLAGGWRRYATIGCVAWSVAYFAMLGRWMTMAAGP